MRVGSGIDVHAFGAGDSLALGASIGRIKHALGVRGWVANLEDGSVEAMIQGPANQVDLMLEWLRRGPPHARVADLVSEERYIEKRFERFEQH